MPALLTRPVLDNVDRRGLLTGAAAAAFLAACARETTLAVPPPATTRAFTHALGTAEIPVSPQRVVALNVTAADPALTLGVPVVGAPSLLPPILEPLAAGIQRLGFEPDLEAIAALQPDLILSAAFEGELFEGIGIDTLTEFAPTIAYAFESDYAWRDYYRFYADALGRVPEAEQRLAEVDERTRAVAAAVTDPRSISVSVIRVNDDGSLAYFRTDDTFAGSVLDPIGFAAPLLDDRELSLENIGLADADLLFVFAGEVTSVPQLDALLAQPIYQTLGAVRAGRAFPVGAHWFGFGVLAAEAILDDVESALS